ncbi:alpha/beta fold hydrolase [Aestuariivita boseongensis]|uniref:alpha/beta fold hydrolase n=1 Tax=Aestuariivita boseongensis TaxID=1470562 RepID=UPI0006821472|nr:alpha/beta hydrolase [Aestuariivita boseongensis]
MAEPVVLIPDLMCDARVFHHQINALSAECAVTIAAPVRGERIEEMASDLLHGVPHRFALAGVGLGAVVAIEMARRAPERVNRLALISADPQMDTPAQASDRELLIARARAGRLEDVAGEILSGDVLAPSARRMEIQALFRALAKELGVDLFIRQQRALQRRRDYQGVLRRVKVPTMVLGGAEDRHLPPKRHQFLADLIPKAQLRLIEGAGRWPHLEQPEAMTEALADWMAQPLILG